MQSRELEELLTKAKELLREETTPISYDTWLKNLEIQSMENGNVTLLISTTFNSSIILNPPVLYIVYVFLLCIYYIILFLFFYIF